MLVIEEVRQRCTPIAFHIPTARVIHYSLDLFMHKRKGCTHLVWALLRPVVSGFTECIIAPLNVGVRVLKADEIQTLFARVYMPGFHRKLFNQSLNGARTKLCCNGMATRVPRNRLPR